VARYLASIGDPRKVVEDVEARYFGGRLEQKSLVPAGEARLGQVDMGEWFGRSRNKALAKRSSGYGSHDDR
jgi:hypothetical protein